MQQHNDVIRLRIFTQLSFLVYGVIYNYFLLMNNNVPAKTLTFIDDNYSIYCMKSD